ncbi:hypothetical protein [Micromonospora chersina]|uniref:hypothetical protein n=1 Tax=Micromonospora chersina TaxID=47854 RepID=UPI0033DFA5D0
MAVDRSQDLPAVGEPTPVGFSIAGGSVLVVGAALLAAAAFTPAELPGRVLVIAAAVGAYAAVAADLRAVAAVSALAAATFVGFLAHRFGELTAPGHAWSYAALIGIAAVLGVGCRYLRSVLDHDEPTSPLRTRSR